MQTVAPQHARAIVFVSPQVLAVQSLQLAEMGPADVEVEVDYSGISTGTERLLWDGTMPPFPGLSYPLVPGYESVGTVVRQPRGAPAGRHRRTRRAAGAGGYCVPRHVGRAA